MQKPVAVSEAPGRPIRPRGPREWYVTRPAPANEWWQELGAAVILQAVSDAQNPSASSADRKDARRFLSGGPGLEAWCNLAGVPVGAVTRWARERAA